MSKPINIIHPIPKPLNASFIAVPIGLYCNRELEKAKPGNVIELWQEWRHEKMEIVQIGKFRINTPEFTYLMRSAYGQDYRLSDLMARWESECEADGIGKNGFDREYCLVVEVKDLERDE